MYMGAQIRAAQHANLPVATGVLHYNVVIFINATYCASCSEGLKHAISPSAMAMLEGLNDF